MERSKMWRQGDVLIAAIEELPAEARPKQGVTVAEGEVTGHRHHFADPGAVKLFETEGLLFVRVIAAEATLIHDEHRSITIPQGICRIWQQREYTPRAIRRMRD